MYQGSLCLHSDKFSLAAQNSSCTIDPCLGLMPCSLYISCFSLLFVDSESKTDESLPKTGFTGYPSCGASKVVAILPGLGQYDESSGSDSASSDSEVDVSTFKKVAHVHVSCAQGGDHQH